MIQKTSFFLSLLSTACFSAQAAATLSDPGYVMDTVLTAQEVVVTGTRSSVNAGNLPMSVSVVTGQQLESRLDQSILPVLTEQVPSLFITSRGVMGYGVSGGAAGSITMRGIGGNGAQLLMLIDGHPQYMGLMGHPLADSYQTLMAERVEVVRGPASVLYGSNAMGGVINIITKQEKQDGVQTHARAMYGSYNTLATELTNRFRSGKFSSVVSLGYNRTDGHRDNMDFKQYTGYVKVGYDFSARWKSFVDLDLTHFKSSNPGSVTALLLDNDMAVSRGVASFSLQNDYERTSGALKFYYNFGRHRINDGYAPGGNPRDSRFQSSDRMFGVSVYQTYSFFRGNKTTAGVDFQRFGGHAWNTYVNGNPNRDLVRESINDVAGYLNFQQTLWDNLTLNAGVRLDHHSVNGNEWIPQLGISWFAGPNTILKGIVSKGFRNPTIRELYMFGTRNPDLEPESLMNYEVSLTQHLFGKLQLGLNLYYIKGKNSIIPDPDFAGQWRNTGQIENYGLELSAQYPVLPGLNLQANYSYLHMKRKVLASPEHKLYVGADYGYRKWNFSTGVQYIHNLVREGGKETFALWNARVGFRPVPFLDLFVRGENLLDQTYQINTGYPMPGATVFGGVGFRF